ncbi:tRNA (guanine(26)-N(2))-dimethyltransferase-like [Octopus sinensis]|uniref:tRNA (guanine(26)-N(2))-dimethyltransferase n=1 Tax=Octopus sinensis TaxID=2607531 RepID=A0A6P7U0T6_9MOLL|nr:tRNA (guanine(26)-N(2))-dimethyltransferase-like [Octopus sinensis]
MQKGAEDMSVKKLFKNIQTLDISIIKEGKAEIRLPSGVFYNKVQEFNRDLTIAVINTFFKDDSSDKIPKFPRFKSPKTKSTPNLENIVSASCGDAKTLISSKKAIYDVIDIDPYGSAVEFIEVAIESVSSGGLLCFTCTDLAVLCGNRPEACYARYNSMPLNTPSCHEMALRIVMRSIVSAAAKHRRLVTPLLSVYVDFYIRIFVTVRDCAVKVLCWLWILG